MPNWHDVLKELEEHSTFHQMQATQTLDIVRRKHLKTPADLTGRNTIAYYSGWLTKPGVHGVEVNDDDMNALMSCIHGLERAKGLDLILHTPGGGIAATQAIVNYLRSMFGRDIRAIVPQLAMSAGTMIALSCSSVVMGKQSSLGPIDPQFGGIPADVVVAEFSRAMSEITEDPKKAAVWAPILGRYTPSFLTQCEHACAWSRTFVEEVLTKNMFFEHNDPSKAARAVVDALATAARNKAHDRHISAQEVSELGVNVISLEADPELQDTVLTVHHCYMHTLASTTSIKIVENQDGRANVRHLAGPLPQVAPQGMIAQA
ncbi:ATP-dependent Clp protease proteolytic subunit [Rhodobacter capsulatus]|uniref:SDH family Clp fold serine proteinase n=1 Tax=Rhodobacter capsulatus TaxID=1061 RepID=UPI0009C03B4B|nr:ATP-dependent Clp protease proteolytic subunit [Rhodobacter capsulatus]PZX26490.1 serine dehydrogenase proteinase [Rhodobacter capsulatus]QNR61975.1 ATP-dependent Clp protease proteolytic subunit [Rhodobacter capsulatus]